MCAVGPVTQSSPIASAVVTHPARAEAGGLAWWIARAQIRAAMACYIGLLRLGRVLGRRRRPVPPGGAEILMTGTFHSDNWVRSHIQPLAASSECARLRIVATNPVPNVPKVEAIYPPDWLRRSVGAVPSRLLTFIWVAVRTRPHVVGSFHLLINGLVTALIGRWIGARSMYFCVGGPVELLDGGVWGENKYFARLKTPDALVERWLLEAVAASDVVITMGTRAVRFFQQRGIETTYHVVAGGIDAATFSPALAPPEFDTILVARLVPIKTIDLYIRTIAALARTRPGTRALIVGDGPLRQELEALVRSLGITANVTFAGQQTNVEDWLRRSRIFVLTSESEGLALSMMEAMTCGLPAVVSRVGDLGDLVDDGRTGYLVGERTADAFAEKLLLLLGNGERYKEFSAASKAAAARYERGETTRLWDRVLADLDNGRVLES
jgi:glycosyltransferase involved in cell wall biosynthesis